MATNQIVPPSHNFTDPRRTSSGPNGSTTKEGKTVFTANAAGTTTTIVGLTAGVDGSNAVQKGERFFVHDAAGAAVDNYKVVTVTAIAKAANDTVTFTPALSVATAAGFTLKSATPIAYGDNDSLDLRLLEIGGIYTQAYIDTMTQNDKIYAVRVNDDPNSIR